MNLVTRIDSLWRVTNLEVYTTLQSRLPLENRNTNIFCYTRINGRLKHDHRSFSKVLAKYFTGTFDGAKIRCMICIHWCWNSYNMELCFAKARRIRCELNLGVLDGIISNLIGRINAIPIELNLLGIEVITNNSNLFCECHRNGHSYIAKSNK